MEGDREKERGRDTEGDRENVYDCVNLKNTITSFNVLQIPFAKNTLWYLFYR